MANKGLKGYTKQLTQRIGDVARVSVNVNKEDANMHIVIPLVKTLGPNSMETSLIWNYQDREEIGHFGKGCQINTYKNITDQESYISVREADGFYIRYNKKEEGIYKSEESSITVEKEKVEVEGDSEEYRYEFKDQQGNRICYHKGNTYYPTSIEYINEERITFNGLDMDNGHGGKIIFTDESGKIIKITCKKNDIELSSVTLGYDSNKQLSDVKWYKENNLIKHLAIILTKDTQTKEEIITVRDEIVNVNIVFTKNAEITFTNLD